MPIQDIRAELVSMRSMEINTEMKNAITKDASTAEIKHLAVENGMETLAAGARRKSFRRNYFCVRAGGRGW